ncbi:MAG: hypothetical protein V3W37_03185 [Candidatus Binatia bacterium]
MPATAILNMTKEDRKVPPPMSERTEAAIKLLDSKVQEENIQDAAEAEAQKVDFADLTAETVTVEDVTIPIPTPLADMIIRSHLQEPLMKLIKEKKVDSVTKLTREAYMLIATQWWVLDHQYEKNKDGRNIIRKFIERPGWRPPEKDLLNYLEDLSLGESLQNFHDAYRTASSLDNAEERRKKVKAARSTGETQKIPVLRPYISQSESPK